MCGLELFVMQLAKLAVPLQDRSDLHLRGAQHSAVNSQQWQSAASSGSQQPAVAVSSQQWQSAASSGSQQPAVAASSQQWQSAGGSTQQPSKLEQVMERGQS
jgi:hypothetical protein